MILRAHNLAQELYDDDYTIEEKHFTDGDKRTIIKHNYGWGAENYVTVSIWMELDMVTVEYYENDDQLLKDIYSLHEWRERPEELSQVAPNW